VSKITQVDQKDIERMAELYATHSPAALLYAMGITQHTKGVDNVKSCCTLSNTPGLTITDMISAIDEGKIKAMYVIGENPKLSDPDWNHLNHNQQLCCPLNES
jgi:predicted molibdopterin-dependent oxidoreductase YjgC